MSETGEISNEEKFTDTEPAGEITVWSEQIAACRSSGISVRAWCEGNGVSTASYYKW